MNKSVACLTLVAGLVATPLAVARASVADPDSSCHNSGLTLNFCGSRAPMFAVAGAAVAGATVLVVSANEASAANCPPAISTTTTTPEPATIALVGIGMIALAGKRITGWRRTNHST